MGFSALASRSAGGEPKPPGDDEQLEQRESPFDQKREKRGGDRSLKYQPGVAQREPLQNWVSQPFGTDQGGEGGRPHVDDRAGLDPRRDGGRCQREPYPHQLGERW